MILGLKLSLNIIAMYTCKKKMPNIEHVHSFLWTLQYFTTDHYTCNKPECESVLVLDGNMKMLDRFAPVVMWVS